jgi:hypothetical protein
MVDAIVTQGTRVTLVYNLWFVQAIAEVMELVVMESATVTQDLSDMIVQLRHCALEIATLMACACMVDVTASQASKVMTARPLFNAQSPNALMEALDNVVARVTVCLLDACVTQALLEMIVPLLSHAQ